jgi:hypothetical protein
MKRIKRAYQRPIQSQNPFKRSLAALVSAALLLSTPLIDHTFWAQEAAAQESVSNEMRIQELIKKGQEALERSKSRRVARNKKKKKVALKEALKSFSFAHRFMTDLQLENQSLSEQINAGYTEALSDPLIQKELNSVESSLIKALAEQDSNKAYEAALELSQLDARSPEYVYLLKVLNTLQSNSN